MDATTLHPGPRKPWILEHFAGDSTITSVVVVEYFLVINIFKYIEIYLFYF
jgi:hypothetical protein